MPHEAGYDSFLSGFGQYLSICFSDFVGLERVYEIHNSNGNGNASKRKIRELKHARFWDADGNRKWDIFTFNLPSHNHIHIA